MDFFKIFAPSYDKFMHLIGHEKSLEKVIKEIDKKGPYENILDIGGGTGTLAIKLQKYDSKVTIVDISEKMLKQARKKGIAESNLKVGDATNLPFPNEEFDLVLCTDALHHFSNKEESLKEMARVLKPGGHLVILEFDGSKFLIKVLKVLEKLVGEPAEFFTPMFLQDELEKLGFKGELRSINSHQYLYVGKR